MLYDHVEEAADYIRSKTDFSGLHAIILGTGLEGASQKMTVHREIPYEEIPHFVKSTVKSHAGKIVTGEIAGVKVLMMKGRLHYYEGYSIKEVTFPVRVMKSLGIEHLLISNAAGGINPHYNEGDIVLIEDHINFLPEHPLRGENEERWGVRFPDMMNAYDRELLTVMERLAVQNNIQVRKGVYLALQGPSLETPAEYKMAHILGADLVGMSTVPEVIVARHSGIKVSAFSIVSNVCFPKSQLSETTVDEVIAVVRSAAGKMGVLFEAYFKHYNTRM
jgi:purine-nucleoside phosphorylase